MKSTDKPVSAPAPRSTRTARLATLATFGGLGLAAIVFVVRSDRAARATADSLQAGSAFTRPPGELTPAEIEAQHALTTEEQRDPRSLATAHALARLALAHGQAGHVEETQAVYTRLLESSRWLGADDVPEINLPENLVRRFDQEGKIAAADSLQLHAYEQRRRILGRKHALTLQTLRDLASRHVDAGRHLAAEPLLRELDTLAGEFSLFRRDRGPLSYPDALIRELADVYRELERPRDRAAALTRLFKTAEPDAWPNELQIRDAIEIALVFEETGAHDTALDVLKRAAQTGSGEGPMVVRKIALAWLAGRGAEVETLERELLARNPFAPPSTTPATVPRTSALSPEVLFGETLDALCQVAEFYRRIGRLDQEARVHGEIAHFVAAGPKPPPTSIHTATSLALAYRRARYWDEAEKYHDEMLQLLRKAPKPDEHSIDYTMLRLANIYWRQDRKADATQLLREVITRVTTQRGAHDWFSMFLTRRRSEFHASQGDLDTAERTLSELLERSRRERGTDCEMTADTMEQLAFLLQRRKKFDAAASLLIELLAIEKRRLGPEHPGTLFVLRLLGDVRRDQGRFAEACTLHERVRADLLRVHGLRHRDAPDVFRALAHDYVARNDFVRAADILVDATRQIPESHHTWNSLAWFRATAPLATARDAAAALSAAQKACELSGWADAFCLSSLAAAHAEAGDFKHAVEHQRQALALAELTEQQRGEWEARLALYLERKPYRQPPPTAPNAE